jgi:hypothetical protein
LLARRNRLRRHRHRIGEHRRVRVSAHERPDAGQLVLEELTSTWHDPEARDALFDIGDI